MALFGSSNKPKTSKDLIPIGAHVRVIGGSYPGHWAIVVGHTPKKYHVRLDNGHVTMLQQTSVTLAEDQPRSKTPSEFRATNYKALITLELEKIQASIDEINNLMTKLQLMDEKTPLASED